MRLPLTLVLHPFLLLAQALRWEVKLDGSVRDIAILPEGNLLITTRRSVQLLSGETGQPLWKCEPCQRVFDPSWQPISPLFPYLYESRPLEVEAGPQDPSVTASGLPAPSQPIFRMPMDYTILNTKTGRILYPHTERAAMDPLLSRLAVAQTGTLVLLGSGRKDPAKKGVATIVPVIAGYDVETGALLFWREACKSSFSEQLVPVGMASDGEYVYYMTNRRVYAVHARTGQTRWQSDIYRGFAPDVRPRLFIDREREQLLVFARGHLAAYRLSDGSAAWSDFTRVRRANLVALFSTPEGLLLFTDETTSPDQPATGRNPLSPPLAVLIDPATGTNRWADRLKAPGILVGYVPLDEVRLLLLFTRERFFQTRDAFWTPDKDWEITCNLLDVKRGAWLLNRPLVIRGGLLNAAPVPGGFLIQTTQSIQAYDETGQALWEKRIRRPMDLPFYISEEGDDLRVFFIDETGQVYLWKGPGSQPERFGNPLDNFAGRDEPQGLLWQKGRLHIWGTSSLYILNERGEIVQSFVREVPGFSAPVRMLGALLSVGGTAARWVLSRQVRWLFSPQDQLPEPVQLRQAIESNPLYAAHLQRIQSLGDLLFLFGREGGEIRAYGVELSSARVVFEKPLGKNPSFSGLQAIEVDPERKAFYLIARDRIEAY